MPKAGAASHVEEGKAAQDEISRFIRSTFRSVWSLEVLLLLKRDARYWPPSEIVTALRASELVVGQSLEALAAAGLALRNAEGFAAYSPAPGLGHLVDGTEDVYARAPDAVRRMIVESSTGGLSAFADAFRLRKD